jgi:hypothetical protein
MQEMMLRSGASSATPVQSVVIPRTKNWDQMHQYSIEALFKRIAIDIGGPFPWSDQGNWSLLIAMDYFTNWLEAYAIPNQEVSKVVEALVTNFFHFREPQELHTDEGRNFESHLMQEVLQL